MKEEVILKLKTIIKSSKSIVFFGGAGVSVSSGIPDFRSADGIYIKARNAKYSAEQIVSHSFFYTYPDVFYDFYISKMVNLKAKPNVVHHYLANLEAKGLLKAVITQNIDGFHQMAGSQNVFELHGSIHRNYCTKCFKAFNVDVLELGKVPYCDNCGAIIKPDVVLFEEGLDHDTISKAIRAIRQADTLIIGGTSLIVQPAASLVNYFQGKNLIIINKEAHALPYYLNIEPLYIISDIAEVFNALTKIDNN